MPLFPSVLCFSLSYFVFVLLPLCLPRLLYFIPLSLCSLLFFFLQLLFFGCQGSKPGSHANHRFLRWAICTYPGCVCVVWCMCMWTAWCPPHHGQQGGWQGLPLLLFTFFLKQDLLLSRKPCILARLTGQGTLGMGSTCRRIPSAGI